MTNNVEKIRNSLGMSRKVFADALDTTYGCISNYENGTRNPDWKMSYKILDLAKQHGKSYKLEDVFPREAA